MVILRACRQEGISFGHACNKALLKLLLSVTSACMKGLSMSFDIRATVSPSVGALAHSLRSLSLFRLAHVKRQTGQDIIYLAGI